MFFNNPLRVDFSKFQEVTQEPKEELFLLEKYHPTDLLSIDRHTGFGQPNSTAIFPTVIFFLTISNVGSPNSFGRSTGGRHKNRQNKYVQLHALWIPNRQEFSQGLRQVRLTEHRPTD